MSFDYGPGLGWGLLALPVSRTEEKKEIAPSELAEELRVGDIATIFTKKNKEHTFRVYRVGPEDFWGETRDGKKYQIPYKHLVKVVVDRESAGYRVVVVLWIGAPIIGSTTQLPRPRGALKEA